MGILNGNFKEEPLHYGEVFTIWSNALSNNGMIASYQTLLNHVGDKDLHKLLEDAIQGLQEEKKSLEKILKYNGILLPPAPPERPYAKLEEIPVGARFLDPEIAAKLSLDIAAHLVACSGAMGMSLREDIAMMFGQFHMSAAQLGAKVLKLNKEKGWLVPPPMHVF